MPGCFIGRRACLCRFESISENNYAGFSSGKRKVFFEFSVFDEPKPTLRIIDINGRKIRDILVLNPRPIATGWIVTWDGTDENGSLVLPGIYIYQWEEGIKTINGTIVVSR